MHVTGSISYSREKLVHSENYWNTHGMPGEKKSNILVQRNTNAKFRPTQKKHTHTKSKTQTKQDKCRKKRAADNPQSISAQ